MAIVAAAVVAGVFVAGSPQEERLRRFDVQRANDLQSIQWQVINYWQSKADLPVNLVVLNDDISGFRVPNDPETGKVYDYEKRDTLKFALCADFTRPSLEGQDQNTRAKAMPMAVPASGVQQNWTHAAGHVCFERTIDPDFYKPREPVKQ